MTCADFESLLSDHAEALLTRDVAVQMEQHRAKCDSCSVLIREVTRLIEDLRNLPEMEPPERLLQTIMDATTGTDWQRSLWKNIVMPTFRPFLTQQSAVAMVAVFVVISVTVNLVGRGYSDLSGADLSPGKVYRNVDALSHRAYRRMLRIDQSTRELWAGLQIWAAASSSRSYCPAIAALWGGGEEIEDEQHQESRK